MCLHKLNDYLVTLEENAIQGGAGSSVVEVLNSSGENQPHFYNLVCQDYFIPQATRQEALADWIDHKKALKKKFSTLLQNKRVIYKINAMII